MNTLLRHAVSGAIAGTAATWAMTKVTNVLYKHEDGQVRRRENRARHGKPANVVAAEKVAGLVGKRLSRRDRKRYGTAVHWATGIGAGMAYGVLRPRVRPARSMAGLGFGTAFWLLIDEAVSPLAGFAPGPKKFPWQAHARGLAGHLAYGAVADTTLRMLQRS